MPADVVVLIATYKRPVELRRLLDCLGKSTHTIHAIVVADNAAQPEIQTLISNFQFQISNPITCYLPQTENRGCGAGLLQAEMTALDRFPEATHFWILDDDVIPPDDALKNLLHVLQNTPADLVVPLLADAKGLLWAFPEPGPRRGARHKNLKSEVRNRDQERAIRQCRTPQDALEKLGRGPHPLCWCTGACVLVTRRALKSAGHHRGDFWILGEDLEFSMRIACKFPAVFVCDVVVPHIPPAADTAENLTHVKKFLSLLQNLAYLGFHQSHGFHIRTYLPGNFRRFFQTFGFSLRTLRWAWLAFWNGAVCGEPAGKEGGKRLRLEVDARHSLP